MKLNTEVLDGVLVIETEEEDIKVVIDVPTGEVLFFEHLEVTINRLSSFIAKAKTRYNKFLNSKAIDDFIQ
ncbi:hypothetical protein LIP24_10370 [Collinsella aerofaciens]|uniref:hypothetical protein n=1 Tax=Collinsella aerofaciens TaxID=74426 RepID=UPI001D0319E3|nr:hypothetical protein [Collinsella aerofaciens]MCB5367037.1 hypothetical protein [Collinsella aerofaciens]